MAGNAESGRERRQERAALAALGAGLGLSAKQREVAAYDPMLPSHPSIAAAASAPELLRRPVPGGGGDQERNDVRP